jgi:hypothetical protein
VLRPSLRTWASALSLSAALVAAACRQEDPAPSGRPGVSEGGPIYALGSLVFGDTADSVYVTLLDSLGEQASAWPGPRSSRARPTSGPRGRPLRANDEDVTITSGGAFPDGSGSGYSKQPAGMDVISGSIGRPSP